jgi:hypothetical protein
MFMRKAVFRYGWILVLAFFNIAELMGSDISPVAANPFEAYSAFMPGENILPLLKKEPCLFAFSEPYNNKRVVECDIHTGLIQNILISVNDDDQIQDVYFFLVECSVKAGNLILWYDADVKATRHGTRRILWEHGQAVSGYPHKGLWTPQSCVWGVWFKATPPFDA